MVTPATRVHCVFHGLTLAGQEAPGASRSGGPAATCGVPRSRESDDRAGDQPMASIAASNRRRPCPIAVATVCSKISSSVSPAAFRASTSASVTVYARSRTFSRYEAITSGGRAVPATIARNSAMCSLISRSLLRRRPNWPTRRSARSLCRSPHWVTRCEKIDLARGPARTGLDASTHDHNLQARAT
jgi:hypothetical protein